MQNPVNDLILLSLLTVLRQLLLDQRPSILNACQVMKKQLLFVFLETK